MGKISSGSIARILWALVLVTLPVTSFRFMPLMGSGTYVRPLALYPLALLLPVLLVRLKQGGITRPWPGVLTVLLAFILAASAATVLGATLAPLELRGVDFFDRAVRAVVTLAIGVSFFIAAIWMNQSEADLKFSVKWLLIGLVAQLLWGTIQFIGLNTGYRKPLNQIQNLFSVRGLVKNKRISGFAYEPSWLAGQIAALYLPWLVAAAMSGYRVFSGKQASEDQKKFPVFSALQPWMKWIEPVLLIGGLAGLLLTYSRSGLFVAFLAGLATLALSGGEMFRSFWDWVRAGFDRQNWSSSRNTVISKAASRILLAVLVLAVIAGTTVFLADKGYIATFFSSSKTDLFSYAVDVYLGPRLAYSVATFKAFDSRPLTGVGLGASGFSIYQNMPDWVLSGVPEIANQMSPTSSLYPNPKNLYVRLLAETGLLGFVLFLAFYFNLFAQALSLLRGVPAARWLAAAGIFALSSVMLQGISQDSFAMPEIWINLGILAGAAGALQNRITKNTKDLQ